jgi:hypothetical protein
MTLPILFYFWDTHTSTLLVEEKKIVTENQQHMKQIRKPAK